MDTYPLEVVLVEDDDIDVETISRSFRGLEFPPQLTVYRTAHEALVALRGQPARRPAGPFLVLLDLNLPGMTGIEFLEKVRGDARLRGIVVFVLTASPADEDRAAAYDWAIAGYMRKSNLGFNSRALVSLVDLYMRYVSFPKIQAT
jgi:CheY-like chemotaxis protein